MREYFFFISETNVTIFVQKIFNMWNINESNRRKRKDSMDSSYVVNLKFHVSNQLSNTFNFISHDYGKFHLNLFLQKLNFFT